MWAAGTERRSTTGSGWSAATANGYTVAGMWASPTGKLYAAGGGRVQRDWVTQQSGLAANDVWGTSDTNYFVVGDGAVARNDQGAWTATTFAGSYFRAVWGLAADDVFAFGYISNTANPSIVHYDGSRWLPLDRPEVTTFTVNFTDAHASNGVLLAVATDAGGGRGQVFRYGGAAWSSLPSTGGGWDIHDIWTDGDHVFAVGGIDETGKLAHFDGTQWTVVDWPSAGRILGVWGSSATDVYAVSGNGYILHYNGTWTETAESQTWGVTNDVFGTSANDVYILTEGGAVHHNDGAWSLLFPAINELAQTIWVTGPSNVYVATQAGVYHYNGVAATLLRPGNMSSVWGTGNDVFASGDQGVMEHFDGTSWATQPIECATTIDSLVGTGPSDVFAYCGGVLFRYDGSVWSPVRTATAAGAIAVTGRDVIVSGDDASVRRIVRSKPW